MPDYQPYEYANPFSEAQAISPFNQNNYASPAYAFDQISNAYKSLTSRSPATISYTPDQEQLAAILSQYGGTAPKGLPTSGGVYTPEGLSQMDKFSDNGALSILTGGGAGFGQIANGNYEAGIANLLTGGVSGLLGFGKRKQQAPSWKPYLGANGQYYWTNPSTANPIGLSDIPGASIAPTKEYQDMANQIRTIQDLLPYYSQAISAQKIPDAAAQLAADTATTGPRLALQESLQRQYGPIFDQLATESNLRKSAGQAGNDLAVLRGPGKELVAAAKEAAMMYDPEYFKTREVTADSVQKLLEQTTGNLGMGMTGTERDEVSRGLALEGSRRGTANAPSQLDTVGNAMAYGAAGRARENDSQNQLSKAIQASTQFLPQSRSNVDVFQVATGKPSYNQQDNRFNTNNATGDASSGAQSLLNTGSSMWSTNTNAANAMALQNDQQNDWGNRLGQITGALGSVGAFMCWVAREVYGPTNPRWLAFREYVRHYAPQWFYLWYLQHGEAFARYIADKPAIKWVVRKWMDSRIRKYKLA